MTPSSKYGWEKKAPNSSDTKELSARGSKQFKLNFVLTVRDSLGRKPDGSHPSDPKKPMDSEVPTQNKKIRVGNRTNSADPQRKQFAGYISNFDVLR